AFDKPHFEALGERIPYLEVPAFAALPLPCILLLSEPQARVVRDVQFAVIDPACLPGLLAVFRHFQGSCFAKLTADQARALTAPLVHELQRPQLLAILPDIFKLISAEALGGFDVDLVEHISDLQLAALDDGQRKQLPAKYPPQVVTWLVQAETHGLPRT